MRYDWFFVCLIQTETVDKTRREYKFGVKELREWLDNAERLVSSPLNCTLHELKTRVKALDASGHSESLNCFFSISCFWADCGTTSFSCCRVCKGKKSR